MNYALSAASCVLRIRHSIKHKESVEDFACLFIFIEALLQTFPTINSPPLRFAYTRHPLPGVDISKQRASWLFFDSLLKFLPIFKEKSKNKYAFYVKPVNAMTDAKRRTPLCTANLTQSSENNKQINKKRGFLAMRKPPLFCFGR